MEVASKMEYGHFLRWAELYRLVGSDAQNVRAAVNDEINDDVKLYGRLASEAKARGENALAEHFEQVKAQEQKQEEAFKRAVDKGDERRVIAHHDGWWPLRSVEHRRACCMTDDVLQISQYLYHS
jgi:rubrerythrin